MCATSCSENSYMRFVCGSAAGVGGTLVPTAFYSMLGLSSAGPVAGGAFATAQAAGSVAAGGWWAALQSAAMVSPIGPIVGSAAVAGGAGYLICQDYLD